MEQEHCDLYFLAVSAAVLVFDIGNPTSTEISVMQEFGNTGRGWRGREHVKFLS